MPAGLSGWKGTAVIEACRSRAAGVPPGCPRWAVPCFGCHKHRTAQEQVGRKPLSLDQPSTPGGAVLEGHSFVLWVAGRCGACGERALEKADAKTGSGRGRLALRSQGFARAHWAGVGSTYP